MTLKWNYKYKYLVYVKKKTPIEVAGLGAHGIKEYYVWLHLGVLVINK
jgi:hypothetical protein